MQICAVKNNEIYTRYMHFQGFVCKSVCGRGSVPDLAGRAYSAPPDPLAGGEGALALGLRASDRPSQLQFLATPMEPLGLCLYPVTTPLFTRMSKPPYFF